MGSTEIIEKIFESTAPYAKKKLGTKPFEYEAQMKGRRQVIIKTEELFPKITFLFLMLGPLCEFLEAEH